MKQPWVYMCSPSRPPLPLPSPPNPSRSSPCTRSERLSHASNKKHKHCFKMQIWTFRFPAHNPLLASHHTENKMWSHIYTLWASKSYSIPITCLDYFLSLPLHHFLMLFQFPLPPCYSFAWNVLPLDVYCILILESSRKTQLSQALDGATLYSHRQETEQDQLQSWVTVPCGQRLPPSSWHRAISLQAISFAPGWRIPLPPHKRQILKWARCYMTGAIWHVHLTWTKAWTLSLKQKRYHRTRW